MLAELYRTQLTELQILGYTEALVEVKPKYLNAGFALAFQKYKFPPSPAEIIEQSEIAAERDSINKEHTTYPPVTQEDREAALQFSVKLKETLRAKEESAAPAPINFKPVGSAEVDEMLNNYRDWLITAAEVDKLDRTSGLSPLPRSQAERLAIYMALPRATRRKLARSGEWTKLPTKNT